MTYHDSDFDTCKICGGFGWRATHKCPPSWWVRDDASDPEDGYRVRKDSPEEAATYYVSYFLGDYGYPDELDVIVRGEDDIDRHFTVRVESEPVFTAHPKETT